MNHPLCACFLICEMGCQSTLPLVKILQDLYFLPSLPVPGLRGVKLGFKEPKPKGLESFEGLK